MTRLAATMAMLLLLVGCGGGEGYVSGTVKLDGEPLPNATVAFYPSNAADQTAPIYQGTTDSSGQYSLIMTATGDHGVPLGKHSVTIEVFEESAEDEPDVEMEPADDTNIVPAKYNVDSELEFEVKPGNNTANWDLSSN